MFTIEEYQKYRDFMDEVYENDMFFYDEIPWDAVKRNVRIQIPDCVESDTLPYDFTVFLLNGYDTRDDDYIPISMNPLPHLMFKIPIHLSPEDIAFVMQFLSENKQLIEGFKNEEIEYDNLCESLKRPNMLLSEMPQIKQQTSGLKYKIWIDNAETYKKGGHWMRIKVQPSSDVKTTRAYATLTIPDMMWIDGDQLDSFEKKRVESFVGYNLKELEMVANKQMNVDDFRNNAIRIDKKGNPIFQDQTPPYQKYKDAGFGYVIYVDRNGKFNYMCEDGRFLFRQWVDMCGEFKQSEKGLRCYYEDGGRCFYYYPATQTREEI